MQYVLITQVISTIKMVFKTVAMGYPQIDTMFRLKWLLMDKNYDFLMNYIEFDHVHCRKGMSFLNDRHFPKWPSYSLDIYK